MKPPSSIQLIWIGFLLMVVGVILPFLMVIHILESTLLLNALAYFSSLFGLLAGLFGVITYARIHRPDHPEDE